MGQVDSVTRYQPDTIPVMMLLCDTTVREKAGFAEWTIGWYTRNWKGETYFGQDKRYPLPLNRFLIWMVKPRKQP